MKATHRLDEVCELVMGQAPAGDNYNTDGKGWPLIAGAGDFGEAVPEAKKFTSSASKISQSGDIVLGIRASIGEKVVADGEYCLGRGVAGLRAGPSLESRYLWHWLTHSAPNLAAKAKGATFKQVNREDIGELEIPLPPLPEQKRIAEILDRAEALRAKRRAALAELDKLTQAIFLEMFGDPVENPKHFPTPQLTKSIELRGGFAFKSDDYVEEGVPLVRIGEVNRGGVSRDNICFLPAALEKSLARFIAYPGDMVMSLTGTTGKDDYANVILLDETFRHYFVNQRVALIEPKPNVLDSHYLLHIFRNPKIKTKLTSKSRGIRQANISNGDVLELQIPIPPIDLQREFSRRVTAVEALKTTQRKSLAELDALFASLQHRAFRGEL